MDHGYAVHELLHFRQQTADRVLINVDTELSAKDLLNNRMAYVSVSRGQWDAQIFTNDRSATRQRAGPRRFAPERLSAAAGYRGTSAESCTATARQGVEYGVRVESLNGPVIQ